MLNVLTYLAADHDYRLVGVASAICLAACSTAFRLYSRMRGDKGQLRAAWLLLAALVCGTAIWSGHFIAIASDQREPGGILILVVTCISSLIVLSGLAALVLESQTTRSALERIRRLANAAHEGLVIIQDGRINDANAAFCDLVGAPLESLQGEPLYGSILTCAHPEASREGLRREGVLQPVTGAREIPVDVFSRLIDDRARTETSGLTVLAVRDLRERRSADEKIRYLADHDGLTGLLNRNSLQARLTAALDRVEASGESLSVISIDLDHFKEANDQHGHPAGDALLVETARRLQDAVAAPSFAARLGGDEFIIVQMGGGEQPAAAAALAGSLVDSLATPVMFEGRKQLTMGASLGVSLYPDDGRTPNALMANADMALYRAKASGRSCYHFFKREMDESIRERRTLARDLKQGIMDGELVVHYQPLARAMDGDVCGFEALARWNHPTRGLIPPLDFIPVAEENGLIAPLGEWVLRRACADAASWAKPLHVAVNLSPLQLNDPALPTLVHEVLIQSGLSPHRLELEITESALFKDYQRALDNLRRLKSLGVRIAMDDFGTGFSSLSTLQSFPFDKIKIDKSFVENIHRHDRATVIVRAVLGLGRSLEIPVVAEGVETEAQILFLRGEDCAELQGYAIGRPAPADRLLPWTALGAAKAKSVPAKRPRRKAA